MNKKHELKKLMKIQPNISAMNAIHNKITEKCKSLKSVFDMEPVLDLNIILSIFEMINTIESVTRLIIDIEDDGNEVFNMYGEFIKLDKSTIQFSDISKSKTKNLYHKIACCTSRLCLFIYQEAFFINKTFSNNSRHIISKESIKSMLIIWNCVKNGRNDSIITCVNGLKDELFALGWVQEEYFRKEHVNLTNLLNKIK